MKDGLKELFPPDIPPLVRWRVAMFIFTVCSIAFMSWSVSPYGFAMAGDQQRVSAQVSDIRLALIEQSVFAAKESECTAADPAARRFFQQRVMTLSREYFVIARIPISIPPCRS